MHKKRQKQLIKITHLFNNSAWCKNTEFPLKFLFLTDTHWRANGSKFRIDDIFKSQVEELTEIESICQQHKPNFILHGGDVVHSPVQPHSIVSTILEWGARLKLPIYSLKGNHDQVGFSDISNSALKTLFSSGIFTELNELVLSDIIIRGIHAHVDPKEGNYVFGPEWNKHFKIVVSHNYISSIPLPFDHVHPKDVVTNANLVLCGHLHHPWTWNSGITTFINSGSVGRWNIEEANRRPKVLLIETSPFTVTEIPLQSSKLGQEIFDLSHVEIEKQKEDQLKSFMESLQSTSFEQSDIEDIVRQAGKSQGIEEPILNKSLEKIQEAKEALK
jgi:DNA repair protein SbcD/Mre11